jgi:hypothetical protein
MPLTLRCTSGNGLVSYYINLVLDGVGITKTDTKAVINGFLQVSQPTVDRLGILTYHRPLEIFNFVMAIGSAMLIDFVGRRRLFIISNSGMLVSK